MLIFIVFGVSSLTYLLLRASWDLANDGKGFQVYDAMICAGLILVGLTLGIFSILGGKV